MSSTYGEGSPRRERLGAALRQLRNRAGLTGPQLAERLTQAGQRMSQSRLSRIETGEVGLDSETVDAWAELCGAPDDVRAELVDLAEQVAVETIAWRKVLPRGLKRVQEQVAQLEASAGRIDVYAPLLIPGLLQTPGYARDLFTSGHPARIDVAEAVAARMNRQAVVYDRAKRLRFVIGEAALRILVTDPDSMRAQLRKVADLVAEPHLDVRVLPFTTPAPFADTGFVILADRADGASDFVGVETITTPLHVYEPAQVAAYQEVFERLLALALAGDDAIALIRQVIAGLGS